MGLSWQQGPLAPRAAGRFLVAVELDGTRLRLEPGQSVLPHGIDRDLTVDQVAPGSQP